MKQLLWATCAAIISFTVSCSKTSSQHDPSLSPSDQSLLTAAQHYFTDSVLPSSNSHSQTAIPRKSSPKTPNWSHARVVTLEKAPAVIVPLSFSQKIYLHSALDPQNIYLIDSLARLLIYPDANGLFHAEIVTAIPDSSFRTGPNFQGIILAEDWTGHFLREYKYRGGAIFKLDYSTLIREQSHGIEPFLEVVSVCYSLDEYNYAADDPDNGVYITEDLGCDTYFLETASGGGGISAPSASDYSTVGGGGGSPSPANLYKVLSGKSPIKNVLQYIQCFQNTAGAAYSVTLYIDQPVPNTRDVNSSSFDVGHTFLEFQETRNGITTRRALGLYPSTSANPLSPTAPGCLNDDGSHIFTVSLTLNLTGSQFMNILNFCAAGNFTTYNLNSNNCTTWALSSLNAGGINIFTTTGFWPLGSGDDPGDLGQDIRSLTLSSNMSRSVTAGNAPSNTGTCN
jgi:hypothetical protein